MPSPDASTHNRVVQGVRNFDSADWHREKHSAVLSGIYANYTQNPAMKSHLLVAGNKILLKASPLDPVWGIDIRADDPRANDPCQWRGKSITRHRRGTFCRL